MSDIRAASLKRDPLSRCCTGRQQKYSKKDTPHHFVVLIFGRKRQLYRACIPIASGTCYDDVVNTRLILAAAVLCTSLANAQQKPALHILVETADQEATQCGITKESMGSAALLALREKGVQASATLTNPYLYISHSAILGAQRSECLVSVLVSVRAINLERPSAYGAFNTRRAYGSSVLCDSGGLLTSRASTMGERVSN